MSSTEELELAATAAAVVNAAKELEIVCARYLAQGTHLGVLTGGAGGRLSKRKLSEQLRMFIVRTVASSQLPGHADAKRYFNINGQRLPGLPLTVPMHAINNKKEES